MKKKKPHLSLLNFKVTPSERVQFNAKAKKIAQGNLSALIRAAVKHYPLKKIQVSHSL